VVLGGSIAGMLAARVLADHFEQVVVVDRDDLRNAGRSLRSGVPWAIHIHALLERGRRIIEGLFPGFTADLAAEGVPVGDYGNTCHYYFNGQRFADHESGMTLVGANRPVIEAYIRDHTLTRAGVTLVDGTEILGLTASADHRTVTGVRLRSGHPGREFAVSADLIVDATGRRSAAPRWLESLGYQAPPEEKVHMGLTYTTMDFVGPLPNDPIGADIALVPTATPTNPRGAIFARLADRYAVTLTGIAGDRAPTNRAGFMEYAATLPIPDVFDAVVDATQRAPAGSFGFPASIRRRYERLSRLPAGFVVVGDAACIFNPVYAQGMTVAAMGAEVLRTHLERGKPVDPRRFFNSLAKETDAPWMMSAAADLGYPSVRGKRTIATRLGNYYTSQVAAGAASDPVLARAFMRTISLIDSPYSLMRPGLAVRVLAVRIRQRAQGGVSSTPGPAAARRRAPDDALVRS